VRRPGGCAFLVGRLNRSLCLVLGAVADILNTNNKRDMILGLGCGLGRLQNIQMVGASKFDSLE